MEHGTTAAPPRARALIFATTAAGAAVLVVALVHGHADAQLLALFAAAAVLAELIQVPSADESFDPAGAHSFSFSIGVHLAAVIVLGPWAAALVAGFGVIAADGLQTPFRKVAYNASMFALAALGGGLVYEIAGARHGTLALPGDLLPLVALAVTAFGINLVLLSGILAATAGTAFVPMLADRARGWLVSSTGEAGLGVAIGAFALTEPWAIVALAPLGLAVYLSHARLAALREQTARALEAFAHVVDERDPYTYRHSERVAEYAGSLAERLGLPSSTVGRLVWAGRLHDVGKIAVDASSLRKPGRLDDAEWDTMQRHPRLSARLLRRFRFAAEEARAVEYHHERADGRGYYGLSDREIPLASHFLIVADSYDAMTSERSYRGAMSREQALAEIERGIGTQFHPAVAKAFVAMQRGEDPAAALEPEERAELRRATLRSSRVRLEPRRALVRLPRLAPPVALVVALAGVGLGAVWLAVPAAIVAAAAVAWRELDERRTAQLASELERLPHLSHAGIGAVASVLERRLGLRWAGTVGSGVPSTEWGEAAHAPNPGALTSWLVRDADADDVLCVRGHELGRDGEFVAVPLRRGGAVAGHLVLALERAPGGASLEALDRSSPSLAQALLPDGDVIALPRLAAVS